MGWSEAQKATWVAQLRAIQGEWYISREEYVLLHSKSLREIAHIANQLGINERPGVHAAFSPHIEEGVEIIWAGCW